MQIHTRDLTADLLAAGTAGWAIDSGLRGHNLGYLIVGAIFAVLASLDMARHLRASRSPRVETLPAAGAMTAEGTDAELREYGREDGRGDALAGREPIAIYSDDADPYNSAYRQAYDEALAEANPEHIRSTS